MYFLRRVRALVLMFLRESVNTAPVQIQPVPIHNTRPGVFILLRLDRQTRS